MNNTTKESKLTISDSIIAKLPLKNNKNFSKIIEMIKSQDLESLKSLNFDSLQDFRKESSSYFDPVKKDTILILIDKISHIEPKISSEEVLL